VTDLFFGKDHYFLLPFLPQVNKIFSLLTIFFFFFLLSYELK
jgi:hypothetical protein